eukprot:SAG31_NODE_535_length_14348_cov_11.339603_3_plen_89_part_00
MVCCTKKEETACGDLADYAHLAFWGMLVHIMLQSALAQQAVRIKINGGQKMAQIIFILRVFLFFVLVVFFWAVCSPYDTSTNNHYVVT